MKGGLPIEAFSRVQELFDGVEWVESSDDAAFWLLKQISSNALHENIERLILSDVKELSKLQSINSPLDSDEEKEESETSDSVGSVDHEKSQHGDCGSTQSEYSPSDLVSQYPDLAGKLILPSANFLS